MMQVLVDGVARAESSYGNGVRSSEDEYHTLLSFVNDNPLAVLQVLRFRWDAGPPALSRR